MTARAAPPVILLASIVLGGCSATQDVAIPADGPWVVGISRAEGIGPALDCLDDEAVTDTIVTANLPGTNASGTIGTGWTTTDVQRVVDCMQRALPDADVRVVSRAS